MVFGHFSATTIESSGLPPYRKPSGDAPVADPGAMDGHLSPAAAVGAGGGRRVRLGGMEAVFFVEEAMDGKKMTISKRFCLDI